MFPLDLVYIQVSKAISYICFRNFSKSEVRIDELNYYNY